jgi:hypothetical protein
MAISKTRQLELDALRNRWGNRAPLIMERRAVAKDHEPTDLELQQTYARMGHLAAHLALLQLQIQNQRQLYCPMLLAGFINVLLRHFPDVELNRQLQSVQAESGPQVPKALIPEHDAPVSFFRDLLMDEEQQQLSVADWHYLVATCYRVKIITRVQNKRLNTDHKQNRPINAYDLPDVEIPLTPASRALEQRFQQCLATYYSPPLEVAN